MYYQQGDVILETVKNVIGNECKPTEKGYVLAEGEVTGHSHRITEKDKVQLFEQEGTLYLKVLENAPLIHEEHKTIIIPQGDYIVKRVNEYDHFLEESRKVQD